MHHLKIIKGISDENSTRLLLENVNLYKIKITASDIAHGGQT